MGRRWWAVLPMGGVGGGGGRAGGGRGGRGEGGGRGRGVGCVKPAMVHEFMPPGFHLTRCQGRRIPMKTVSRRGIS